MAKTVLEQLRSMTTVVADTGDFHSIEKFKPTDSTTNPSLITTAAQLPGYSDLVDGVLKNARNQLGESADEKDVANLAFKQCSWFSTRQCPRIREASRAGSACQQGRLVIA